MSLRALLACLLLACPSARAAAPRRAGPEGSVVRITTFFQRPVWNEPWRSENVGRGTGTGFVIQGQRILTNAHVVSWAKEILVQRHQDPRPFTARVAQIGHDCDLAVLEVQDPEFFRGVAPLAIGGLPKVRSSVVTYGYPAGGEEISYTRGVVSRIEVRPYSHIENRSFLTGQTDAAVNPGNSGGPVVQGGRAVGVAFQGTRGLENTGYFIPPPVIEHFLKDISDGRYDGFPVAGAIFSPLRNPGYRRFLKLGDDGLGIRVNALLPVPAARRQLRIDDVLLQVAGTPVASDGTVLYEGNRVNVGAVLDRAFAGDEVPLALWREGKKTSVSLPVSVYAKDRSQASQYDRLPRYYVHAGLVFTPLSKDYLATLGPDFGRAASPELVYELNFRELESPQEARAEPVVLAKTLSHPVNADMQIRGRSLVDRINGVRIERLEDVIRAFESSPGGLDVIEFAQKKTFECLDHEQAAAATAEVLKAYAIPSDRRL